MKMVKEKVVFQMFFLKSSWVLIGLCFFIMFSSSAYSITFTSNTVIAWDNNLYEGQDIIINGCTITINGEHAFNSLVIINGGALKHSAASKVELGLAMGEVVVMVAKVAMALMVELIG